MSTFRAQLVDTALTISFGSMISWAGAGAEGRDQDGGGAREEEAEDSSVQPKFLFWAELKQPWPTVAEE